jgi:hypothetical protein
MFHSEQCSSCREFVYDLSAVGIITISRLFLVTISEQCVTIMVLCTLEQGVFLYDTYVNYSSARKCQ